MKAFACSACGNRVYFENDTCLACGHALGFDAATLSMTAVTPVVPGDGLFQRVNPSASQKDVTHAVRYCENALHAACNWLVADDSPQTLCQACGHNRTIPNLSEPGRLDAWREVEQAKKRLVYSLLRFGLPLGGDHAEQRAPLTFDLIAEAVTSHQAGVITLDVLEADSVERERRRMMFGEPYRSVLGHLRHEIGHYYWMVLVDRPEAIEEFRAVFGDERADYDAALQAHYAEGVTLSWPDSYVSAYASSHPWEDWAETWAHYLHMVDAVDTAAAEGIEPRRSGIDGVDGGGTEPGPAYKAYDVYRQVSFDELIERWVPLTLALNNLSRSLGHRDFYPFVISGNARAKLAFVHRLVRAAASF